MSVTEIKSSTVGNKKYTLTAVDASGTNSSDEIDCLDFGFCHFQVVHASHTGTSTWELQGSNDGTNWDTISGSSTTTSGASGSSGVAIHVLPYDKIRLTITSADSGSATLTPHVTLKRHNTR